MSLWLPIKLLNHNVTTPSLNIINILETKNTCMEADICCIVNQSVADYVIL